MRVKDIVRALETVAPPAIAEPWDRVGLQVGDPDAETNGCLLTLDISTETLREARRCGVALVVAHHPLIFTPLSAVTAGTVVGEVILAAARAGVSIYVAHTNLDASLEVGTAAALADRLGLERGPALVPVAAAGSTATVAVTGEPEVTGRLLQETAADELAWHQWPITRVPGGGEAVVRSETTTAADVAETLAARAHAAGLACTVSPLTPPAAAFGMGMTCRVPEIKLGAFAQYVAAKLGRRRVTMVGDAERTIRTVALVPGSGGGLCEACAAVDAMVTGEVKYHEAHQAHERGMGIIAAGHYETERPVLDGLARHLEHVLGPRLTVAITQVVSDPFRESATE